SAGEQGPADPRRRAQVAGGRRFRVRQGLLWPGPASGAALHRHRAPHGVGHGRAGGLCRHRRLTAPPHRYPAPPAARTGQPPPADPGKIPLTVPETARLLTEATAIHRPPGHTHHWSPARAVTQSAGRRGGAAPRPAPAGTTSAPALPASLPWSASVPCWWPGRAEDPGLAGGGRSARPGSVPAVPREPHRSERTGTYVE